MHMDRSTAVVSSLTEVCCVRDVTHEVVLMGSWRANGFLYKRLPTNKLHRIQNTFYQITIPVGLFYIPYACEMPVCAARLHE